MVYRRHLPCPPTYLRIGDKASSPSGSTDASHRMLKEIQTRRNLHERILSYPRNRLIFFSLPPSSRRRCTLIPPLYIVTQASVFSFLPTYFLREHPSQSFGLLQKGLFSFIFTILTDEECLPRFQSLFFIFFAHFGLNAACNVHILVVFVVCGYNLTVWWMTHEYMTTIMISGAPVQSTLFTLVATGRNCNKSTRHSPRQNILLSQYS